MAKANTPAAGEQPQDGAPQGDLITPVKARVLITGTFGQVNTVVTLPPAEAAQGTAAGELDTDPAAVAYAESLAQA